MAALVLLRSGAAGVGAKGVGGDPANVEAGQAAFLHRARMNSLAAAGEWSADDGAGGRGVREMRPDIGAARREAGADIVVSCLLLVFTLPVGGLVLATMAVRHARLPGGTAAGSSTASGECREGASSICSSCGRSASTFCAASTAPGDHARMHEGDPANLTWAGQTVPQAVVPRRAAAVAERAARRDEPRRASTVAASDGRPQVERGVDYRLQVRAGGQVPRRFRGDDVRFEELDLEYVERCSRSRGALVARYDLGILAAPWRPCCAVKGSLWYRGAPRASVEGLDREVDVLGGVGRGHLRADAGRAARHDREGEADRVDAELDEPLAKAARLGSRRRPSPARSGAPREDVEAELGHPARKRAVFVAEPVAQLVRALDQLERAQAGGGDRRRDAVREEVRPGALAQELDDLASAET